MTTKSSTPGPWSWDGKCTVGIPHIDGNTFVRTHPEDARLIAAAPDLLEALQAAEQFMWPDIDRGPAINGWHNTMDTIVAAVRKAGR